MIKTFLIDWPDLILFGILFGFACKKRPEGSVFKTKAFLFGSIVTLIFIAAVAYSYTVAPDWMWMYFVDHANIPAWIIIYVLILYYVAFVGGFVLKFELARIHPAWAVVALILSLVAAGGVIVPVADRYLNVMTTAEYLSGVAGTPLPKSQIGMLLNIASGAMVVVGVPLFIWSRKTS